MALENLRDVLAGSGFRKLYATRLTGQFADGLLQSALATFVLFSPERQPTAAKVAVAFAVLLIPYSVIGPFAGVFLDRWSRRQVLVFANILRAIVAVALIALVAAGNDGWLLGLVVLVVLGIGRFVLAGISASTPHVVAGNELVTANALSPTSGTIAAAIGALIGVLLRSVFGGSDGGSIVVLCCAIGMYLVAALIARFIGKQLLGPHGDRPSDTFTGVFLGLVDGVRVLRAQATAAWAIGIVTVHRIAFGALTVVALLLVRNTLNIQSETTASLGEFAFVTGAAALGALIGAVLTPGASRRIGAVRWSAIALVQAGIGVAILVPLTNLPALLVAGAMMGFAGQSVKVCADTITQATISDDHLGRVFALFDMAVNVGLVTGITLMAFVAPATGIAPVADIFAGALLIVAALLYLKRFSRKGAR